MIPEVNNNAATFLRAEWRKLVMANYVVDPELLRPYLPNHTELDLWNGCCYVSLVGFMFLDTKVKGIRVPFHTDFEEVNLRFYVRYYQDGEYKRGVVFIKEIVPKPALTLVANLVYGEHYETMPMRHSWVQHQNSLEVEYGWKKQGKWNVIRVVTDPQLTDILGGSEEEFITEHYWGYTKITDTVTSEYAVEHPRWQVYRTISYEVDTDFAAVYGPAFAFLTRQQPASVFLAEGSLIQVKKGGRL